MMCETYSKYNIMLQHPLCMVNVDPNEGCCNDLVDTCLSNPLPPTPLTQPLFLWPDTCLSKTLVAWQLLSNIRREADYKDVQATSLIGQHEGMMALMFGSSKRVIGDVHCKMHEPT